MIAASFLLLSSVILFVHTSVPFVMNPGCTLVQCRTAGQPALFYANHPLDEDTLHILYSSFDELTISVIQMKTGHALRFNYTALFSKNYSGSISFGDTTPSNSFSLILRRLLQFTDPNDTGRLNGNDEDVQSYWLNEMRTNITDRPSFYLPLANEVRASPRLSSSSRSPSFQTNGLLTVDISYPGETTRDSKFPKMQSTPKSYVLNLALQAENYTSAHTRFAFEFYVIQLGDEGAELVSSRFIDDQYTPGKNVTTPSIYSFYCFFEGIFNVWQLKSLSPIYSSSMLWKPVVYRGPERSVENTTLMAVYPLENNVTLHPTIDRGIFNALYGEPFVSGFNISLGRAKDGLSSSNQTISVVSIFSRFLPQIELFLHSIDSWSGHSSAGFDQEARHSRSDFHPDSAKLGDSRCHRDDCSTTVCSTEVEQLRCHRRLNCGNDIVRLRFFSMKRQS